MGGGEGGRKEGRSAHEGSMIYMCTHRTHIQSTVITDTHCVHASHMTEQDRHTCS